MAAAWDFAKQGDKAEAVAMSASQECGTFGPVPMAGGTDPLKPIININLLAVR